jgi:DNA-binding MarR family transcriptional regulator
MLHVQQYHVRMSTTRPIPRALDDALGFNLYRVALLFRGELVRALSDYGLTPEQWQVMQAVWTTDGPLMQNDVAGLTLKDRHTVSRILARLERDGWIERRPHPDDPRALDVVATEAANARRDEVPRVLNEHFDRIYEVFGPGEADELMRLLRKLRARLE